MNTNDIRSIHSIEHEGFFYVVTNDGVFGKGCRRCGGTGHYSFNGFDSICYLCQNVWEERLGDIFETEEDAQRWCHQRAVAKEKRDAKREQERLAKVARRAAAWDALEAEHPAVWALLTSVQNVRAWDQPEGNIYPQHNVRDSFVLQLADQLWRLDEKPFSPRQLEVLESKAAQHAAKLAEAAANPVVEGRQVITGEVISTKVVDGDYGVSFKMLIKEDRGFRLFGTIPSSLLETTTLEEAVGRRVTFTATVQVSQRDQGFGFYSRPTKSAWVK